MYSKNWAMARTKLAVLHCISGHGVALPDLAVLHQLDLVQLNNTRKCDAMTLTLIQSHWSVEAPKVNTPIKESSILCAFCQGVKQTCRS